MNELSNRVTDLLPFTAADSPAERASVALHRGIKGPLEAEDAGLKSMCHTVGFLASLHPTHLSWPSFSAESQSQPNNKKTSETGSTKDRLTKTEQGIQGDEEEMLRFQRNLFAPGWKRRRKIEHSQMMKAMPT